MFKLRRNVVWRKKLQSGKKFSRINTKHATFFMSNNFPWFSDQNRTVWKSTKSTESTIIVIFCAKIQFRFKSDSNMIQMWFIGYLTAIQMRFKVDSKSDSNMIQKRDLIAIQNQNDIQKWFKQENMIQMWFKRDINANQRWFKSDSNDIQLRFKNDSNAIETWKADSKLIQTRIQIDSTTIQKWFNHDSKVIQT